MCAVFHQFTPAELYIGMIEPTNPTADNALEKPFTGFRATGYPFLDIFLSNLHQYGICSPDFHSAKLEITKQEFCLTLQTLTGLTFSEFTDDYILLMAKDLLKNKNKDLVKISKQLGFASYSGFYRFMIRKEKVKPSWM